MDLFDDFERELERSIDNIKEEQTRVFFPDRPNSFYSFPYRVYFNVPFEERYKGEWLLYKCNYELNTDADIEIDGWYPPTEQLFINYRIDLLKDEIKVNQYWLDYSNYLKQKAESNTIPPNKEKPEKSEPDKTKEKSELRIDQIALKYAYEGLQITRENGNNIAKEYGHNSGEKLFQRFTYFSSSANRKGKPNLCTPKKLDNKIKLIESIIELLPTDKQERAKDEVLILKNIYEAEYQ